MLLTLFVMSLCRWTVFRQWSRACWSERHTAGSSPRGAARRRRPSLGWLTLPVLGCLMSLGCGYTRVNTVPWWKGLPTMIIAPSSLEASVWRDHLRARHDSPSVAAPAPVVAPYGAPHASHATTEVLGEPATSLDPPAFPAD